jgi:hypothetical protein
MAKSHNTALKLEPAFPAAPFKSSKWGFYIQHTKSTQTSFFNFGADYSAKHFLDFMINDKPFKWLSQESIVTDDGVVIRCEQGPKLEELMEYDFDELEAEWEIPEPYMSQWRKLRGEKVTHTPNETPSNANDAVNSALKRVRNAKERHTAPKSREGLVTLAEIATALTLDPADLRKLLRKNNVTKPDAGWAWPQNEVEDVKKMLGGLK